MFEYTCPTCQATTKVQNLQSGTVTACKTCGQGLRVVLPAPEAPPRSSVGAGCMALVVGACGLLGMTFASLIVLAWALLTPDTPGNQVVVAPPPKPAPPVVDKPPPETKRGESPTTEKTEIGPQPPKVDKLALARTGLHDLDPKVRQGSVTALGELGAEGGAAVGDLAEALKDPDEGVRAAAASALDKVGPKAQDVFPDLLTALNDAALLVRDAAGRTLDSLGVPPSRVPLLQEALRDPRSQARVRLYALRILATKGEAKDNLPLFTAALKHSDAEVRLEAVRGLGKFAAAVRDAAFPPLVAALDDGDAGVREAAFEVVSHLRAPGSADLPALRSGLKVKAVKARRYFARALAALGPDARGAVAELNEALTDSDPEVRTLAARALVSIGPEEKAALPGIGEALKSRDETLRQAAVKALQRADADTVLPLYEAALKEDDVGVRKMAVTCLGQLGPRALASAGRVRPLVDDPNVAVRLPAAEALWLIQGQPFVPVQALLGLLKNKDARVRQDAAEALGRIGPPAAAAFVPLTELLVDNDIRVRQASVTALKRIGGKDTSAIPKLIAALADKPLAGDVQAILAGMGKAAVEPLMKALEDENASVRAAAAVTLGKIGPDAADAARVLKFHSGNDNDPEAKQAAAEALKKVKR
jgi:HEAT repeat protein/DNA-directed RNA polymerase subunit RPC12/RpoP